MRTVGYFLFSSQLGRPHPSLQIGRSTTHLDLGMLNLHTICAERCGSGSAGILLVRELEREGEATTIPSVTAHAVSGYRSTRLLFSWTVNMLALTTLSHTSKQAALPAPQVHLMTVHSIHSMCKKSRDCADAYEGKDSCRCHTEIMAVCSLHRRLTGASCLRVRVTSTCHGGQSSC